jgi:flagellin-like hook-associated protein FlgL
MQLTLTNPLSTSSSFAAQKNQETMKRAGADLSTGRKTNNDVISNLLGKSLEQSSSMLRVISKNIGYGTMIANTAETDLHAAKDALVKLKQTIISANTAQGTNLATINQQYLDGEENVKRILNQSQMDGRDLFKHNGALDIEIRTDENIQSKTTLSLPDLRNETTHLQGNAVVDDNTKHSLIAGNAWGNNAQTASENQASAEDFVNNLITTIDTALNNITSQKSNLQATNETLLKKASIQDEAAGNYLNTDYESTAEEFKKAMMSMRASLAVLAQGEMVGQLALKLIEQ